MVEAEQTQNPWMSEDQTTATALDVKLGFTERAFSAADGGERVEERSVARMSNLLRSSPASFISPEINAVGGFSGDSSSAVSWVNDKGYGNLRLWDLIGEIRSLLVAMGNASVDFCPREENEEADSMAKKGVTLVEEVIVWKDP